MIDHFKEAEACIREAKRLIATAKDPYATQYITESANRNADLQIAMAQVHATLALAAKKEDN